MLKRHLLSINLHAFIYVLKCIFFEFIIKSQKLPAMVLAWENLLEVFVMLVVSSFCCSSFVNVLYSHFLLDIIPQPSVYYQLSPLQSDSRRFHFQPFRYLLTASATVLSGYFLSIGVFYLTLLPNIFRTACFYQDFAGSRQLFLDICRASYWSSKHRRGLSVCLIYSNPQSFIHLKFVIIHVNIVKVLLVVKTLIKSVAKLFSSHEI